LHESVQHCENLEQAIPSNVVLLVKMYPKR